MGPAERAAGNDLQGCDFVEGVEVKVGLDFISAFNDFELSAPLNCGIFEDDRAANFGASEFLGTTE